jgi:ribosomal protein L37AE/L43A
MKSTDKSDKQEVRMELKYCERCGSLRVRECGAGVIYCDHCVPEVAELPATNTGRLILPVQPRSVIEQYDIDDEDSTDFEAAGGAA